MKNTKKVMNSDEYLQHLTTEKRRSALLESLEDDPVKRKNERKKQRKLDILIQRVKRMGHGRETCTMITGPEDPERTEE